MAGPLYQFFIDDHRRLEELLNQAVAAPGRIHLSAYDAFRRGLLKHISMEEKVLLPAAQRARDGEPLPTAAKLRLDHAALAALLVPPPSAPIIAAIRAILADHNRIEESPQGLYDLCEQMKEADALMAKVLSAPDLVATPYNPDPNVLNRVRRILEKAGYNFDDYLGT